MTNNLVKYQDLLFDLQHLWFHNFQLVIYIHFLIACYAFMVFPHFQFTLNEMKNIFPFDFPLKASHVMNMKTHLSCLIFLSVSMLQL